MFLSHFIHKKNDFVEIFKNLARFENNLLGHQNNYVENSSTSNVIKKFNVLATRLSVLHNYFNNSTKLFSDLYLAKFFKTVFFVYNSRA